MQTTMGILIPFFGTTLGAAAVFFMRSGVKEGLARAMSGFAAGVMVAASLWSLILPAIEQSAKLGSLSFLPACAGLWAGFLFLLALDRFVKTPQEVSIENRKIRMMIFAVTLHNLPEGMAVGVAFAAIGSGEGLFALSAAFALSVGIAIQNIPEGAIVSMPLTAGGMGKGKSFLLGTLSGAVEPLGAVLTLLASRILTPALPYFLGFAAGAMLCVAIRELIPDCAAPGDSGTLSFALGFSVMMILDVLL